MLKAVRAVRQRLQQTSDEDDCVDFEADCQESGQATSVERRSTISGDAK